MLSEELGLVNHFYEPRCCRPPNPASQEQQAGEYHSKFSQPCFSLIYNRTEQPFLVFLMFATGNKDMSQQSCGSQNIPHPASVHTPDKLQQLKTPALVLCSCSLHFPQHRPLLSRTVHAARAQDMVPPALSALTMTCSLVARPVTGQTWAPVHISYILPFHAFHLLPFHDVYLQ